MIATTANHFKIRFAGNVPKCATAFEYRVWRDAAKSVPGKLEPFCADCAWWYQDEMKALDLCENPDYNVKDSALPRIYGEAIE